VPNTATETAQQKAVREAREKLHAHLRTIMQAKDGRGLVGWVMLDLGGLLSQSDAGELTHTSARNAGRRDVALELLDELKVACPNELRTLWSERLVEPPRI